MGFPSVLTSRICLSFSTTRTDYVSFAAGIGVKVPALRLAQVSAGRGRGFSHVAPVPKTCQGEQGSPVPNGLGGAVNRQDLSNLLGKLQLI